MLKVNSCCISFRNKKYFMFRWKNFSLYLFYYSHQFIIHIQRCYWIVNLRLMKQFPIKHNSTTRNVWKFLVEVSCWTCNWEQLSISLVVISLYQWELDLGIVELLNMSTACFDCDYFFNFNNLWRKNFTLINTAFMYFHKKKTYLNWMGASTMTWGHIGIALCNCSTDSEVTVFTVHVVGSWTWIISKPDAEIFDFEWCFFVLSFNTHNFTSCLLELTQLTQEIPETTLGNDMIWCENVHFEERWIWILFGWQFSANDLIFFKLKDKKK